MVVLMLEEDDSDPVEDEEPEIEDPEKPAGNETSSSRPGYVVPPGFYQSLLPDITKTLRGFTNSIMASYRDRMTELAKVALPTFDYVMPISPELSATIQAASRQWSENILENLRKSLGPILDPEVLRGFQRNLLPPNLREHVEEVSARQVYDFLQEEGIPLYLVPRGTTAVRFLRAADHQSRRKVLSDRYGAIIEDCEEVLSRARHPSVRDEVLFVLDGIGAMRAGHTRSAQALFTVTLDSMIYRFYPERDTRTKITNRKKGADVPDLIDSMGVHQAFVWLPVWNAHEQFWKDKGDQVPHQYSRHASVHGVSKRQFSKRNCVQALMLVTSLIAYADRLDSEGRT